MRGAFLTAVLCTACGSSVSQTPGCTEEDAARAHLALVTETMMVCAAHARLEDCPEFPGIRERYERRREEWVSCR
jgi:hypothetical protein